MTESFYLLGTVRDGVGGASRDTRHGIYPQHMLGFLPYAGSLNLDVEPDDFAVLLGTGYDFAVHYAGTDRPMWHAFTVDMQPCMVQWHEKMPEGVAEIFAPVHLRSNFGLSNGDVFKFSLARTVAKKGLA